MWERIKRALAFVMFAMMPVFFFFLLGPGIWADFTMQSGGLVPAENVRVDSAWCKPSQIFFSDCDVRLEVAGQDKPVELEFMAMAGYIGKYEPKALRSVAEPARFTSSLNIDALRSRIIAFIVLFGGTLWMFGVVVWINVRDRLRAPVPQVAPSVVRSRSGSVVRANSFGRRSH